MILFIIQFIVGLDQKAYFSSLFLTTSSSEMNFRHDFIAGEIGGSVGLSW